MMLRKVGFLLVVSVVIGLAGCMLFSPVPDDAEYVSIDGGFSIRVPLIWQVEELDSLIEGVVFTDSSPGGSTMRFWILFGPASGRTAAEIVASVQGLRVLLLESGTSLTDWVQDAAVAKTLSGMPAREASYDAEVSGLNVAGIAVACTDGLSDYVILAEVAGAIFYEYAQSFNDAIRSFTKTN